MKLKVLVTGGSGLVGGALVRELIARRYGVRVASRQPLTSNDSGLEQVSSPELSDVSDWSSALLEIDAVVHCAARVHVMDEGSAAPLEAFRTVNTAGTLNFAQQCAEAGVKRLPRNLFLKLMRRRLRIPTA
jgi:nucleoside-diphosphate-sugar epimerase